MLKRAVRQALDDKRLIPANTGILVAVSGGVDSIVLLHTLRSLAIERNWRLVVGHVNHALRGAEADADARFVERIARGWDLTVKTAKLNENIWLDGGNKQDVARRWRYRHLEDWADELDLDWIATAHHADDQAETVIERLARGAGLEGLTGIPVVRGRIVRPLLYVSRAEIECYARQNALMWREDPSNQSAAYRRNRIRQDILPVLNDMVSGASSHIAAAATRLAQAHDALSQIACDWLDRSILEETPGESLSIRMKNLSDQPIGLRMVIWREAIRRLLDAPPRRFTQPHWDQIDKLATNPTRIAPLTLPQGIIAKGGKDSISFSFEETEAAIDVDIDLNLNGVTETPIGYFETRQMEASALPHEIEANEAYFDLKQLTGTLRIRNISPGLRIHLPQLGHKRIAKLLSEAGIPRHLRFSHPILWLNETVLWVPGIRRSSHALVSSESRTILGIKYNERGSN